MPYAIVDTKVEVEVEVDFDDLPKNELKDYAIEKFGLLEDMNAEVALDVLRDIKRDTAGIGKWTNIKYELEKLLEE